MHSTTIRSCVRFFMHYDMMMHLFDGGAVASYDIQPEDGKRVVKESKKTCNKSIMEGWKVTEKVGVIGTLRGT